jgi:DNA-binding NarL/FixJ family response regulator
VDPAQMLQVARMAGLDAAALRSVMYELPEAAEELRRPSEPSPLTPAETRALRGLAEGKVYKQIAADLTISVSTVRTHLHNSYRKLGAADRAQAVLLATERGWI